MDVVRHDNQRQGAGKPACKTCPERSSLQSVVDKCGEADRSSCEMEMHMRLSKRCAGRLYALAREPTAVRG